MAQHPRTAGERVLQDKTFLVLLVAVTLAFAWILWPFYAVIFWATVLAILFAPLHRRFARTFRRRETLAALATTGAVIMVVLLPAGIVMGLLIQEGFGVYNRIQSGELSFARYFEQVLGAMP